jgi:Ca-activated chloride channel family protein
MPVSQLDGRDVFLRDDDGQLLTTRFNETTLRMLAEATGGHYVRSTNGSELLEAIEDIAASELRQTGWRTTTEYRDVFGVMLAAAALAAVGLVALL